MPSSRYLATAVLFFCALPMVAQVSFTTETYSAPSNTAPGFTIAADLDRDGNPDLITTDSANSQLLVFYGTGGGKFAAPEVVAYTGGPAGDVQVGDFNGDGKLDLLISCWSSNTVVVLTGNGNRTFNYSAIQTAEPPYYLAVGDFNNDGKLDFAVALRNPSDGSGTIQIYNGNGNATFNMGTKLALPATSYFVSDRLLAQDLNKDGKIDLVNVTEPASVFLNNGNASFTLAQTISAVAPQGMVGVYYYGELGDLNGDTAPDLLLTDSGFCGEGCGYFDSLDSYLNDGTGHFTLKQQVAPQGLTVAYGELADLNYDFKKDVFYTTFYDEGQLGYALGNGDGTFQTPQLYGGLNNDQPPITAHDLNNDGQMDIVSTGRDNLMVLLNTTAKPDCASPNSKSLASDVCSPKAGENVSTTFPVRAVANGPVEILRIEEWLDNKKVYQQLSNQVSNNLTAGVGTHTLSVVAVDVLNEVEKTNLSFTISGCGAPAQPGVNICTPIAGATVTSPVSVTAAATASNGTHITAMRLYVDYVATYTENGAALSTSIALAAGSHHLSVVAYEANGSALKSSETITAQ